ncbi:hypothetical protein [Candidatus Cryosericum septentrionale]|jgi:hypothetical protein|uniref:Uncharacterized protein n=1 Tax=Candidatus Cryosericum septentrionale TaxID=2290913 RepID=A0A398E0R6_9BACT|nr:hypothetical protein [Candidatus Cryosericum septentrionale]RIE17697.1 hypothetical protein SMC1_00495 [Candidatus Cryosericum septentrionale]
MTSYTLVLRDACGAKFREVVSLDQLKRENPADALDIELALTAGRNFRVRDRRGSLTVYAH